MGRPARLTTSKAPLSVDRGWPWDRSRVRRSSGSPRGSLMRTGSAIENPLACFLQPLTDARQAADAQLHFGPDGLGFGLVIRRPGHPLRKLFDRLHGLHL